MKDIFDFQNYSHILGSDFYKEKIKKDVSVKDIKSKLFFAKYLLSDYYPILVRPSHTTVYYNIYNSTGTSSTIGEDFLSTWGKEIRNCFNSGYDYLVFIDKQLVATDGVVYLEHWYNQPISLERKISSYSYITIALPHKGGMTYFIYPLKSLSGGSFLEAYHGRYLSKKGIFTDFGLDILSDMISLTYDGRNFTSSGFKESFVKDLPEELRTYNILRFIKKEKNTL